MSLIKKIIFLKAFLKKNELPAIYKSVNYKSENVYKRFDPIKQIKEASIYFVQDIPSYFNIEYSNSNFHQHKTIKTLKGHAVLLEKFNTISDYLNSNFSSKSRSNLKRYNTRLETCFNITYKTYYGSIDKLIYDNLLNQLETLLIRRFKEKQEKNYELQHFDEFRTLFYDLIIQKKANIYVIYNDSTPISIRLNIINQSLAYYIISGYDIDYSKFHLGSIDMLKNIDWCIENNMKIYDLLKGYDYYKKKWANYVYHYTNQITFNSSSIKALTIASLKFIIEKGKYRVYHFLKSQGYIQKLKNVKKKIASTPHALKANSFQFKELEKSPNHIEELDFVNVEKFAFLKQPIYDYLFLSKQNLKDIRVFKVKNTENTFIIKGQSLTELTITST